MLKLRLDFGKAVNKNLFGAHRGSRLDANLNLSAKAGISLLTLLAIVPDVIEMKVLHLLLTFLPMALAVIALNPDDRDR